MRFLLALVVLCGCVPALSDPENLDSPLPVEVAIGLPSLRSAPQISPDGTLLAYAVVPGRRQRPFKFERNDTTGIPMRGLDAEIRIRDLGSGDETVLTSGQNSEWAPVWSPDGRMLAFFSDRDGAMRLWVWQRATRQVRRVSEAVVAVAPSDIEDPIWVGGGRKLFAAFRLFAVADATDREAWAGRSPNDVTVSALSSLTPKDAANTRVPHEGDFAFADVATGELHRVVLDTPAQNCVPSPAATLIACNVIRPGQTTSEPPRFAVFSPDGRQRATLPTTTRRGAEFSWSPDGRYLVVGAGEGAVPQILDSRHARLRPLAAGAPRDASMGRGRWDVRNDFYFTSKDALWRLSPMRGNTLLKRTTQLGDSRVVGDQAGLAWHPGGTQAVVLRSRGSSAQHHTMDLATGAMRSVLKTSAGAVTLSSVGVSGRTHFIYEMSGAGDNSDFWLLDTRTASKPTRITTLGADYERHRLGSFQSFESQSELAHRLQHSLLLPAGFRSDRRYPLMVAVYGGEDRVGDRGTTMGGWRDFQILATRGYAVLQPAVPIRVGHAVDDLVAAVLPAVDKLIKLGIADPERLALSGISFGGYTAKALLTRTTRFKAAVTSVGGGGNLFTMYANLLPTGSDSVYQLEGGQYKMPGDPWTHRQAYLDNSPFFQYDKIRTPLMIQSGLSDGRQIVLANEETFVALRRLGLEVEFLRYTGEGHSLYGYANQIDFANRQLTFLAQHLDLALDEHGAVIFDGDRARSREGSSAPGHDHGARAHVNFR